MAHNYVEDEQTRREKANSSSPSIRKLSVRLKHLLLAVNNLWRNEPTLPSIWDRLEGHNKENYTLQDNKSVSSFILKSSPN